MGVTGRISVLDSLSNRSERVQIGPRYGLTYSGLRTATGSRREENQPTLTTAAFNGHRFARYV